MRLDNTEKEALRQALTGIKGQKYLFGSRVSDDKKGGDIDILIFGDENSFQTAHRVSVEFFKHCESKIDVIVMNPDNLSKEQISFLKTIITEEIKFE